MRTRAWVAGALALGFAGGGQGWVPDIVRTSGQGAAVQASLNESPYGTASPAEAVEQLLDFAEATFPAHFPGRSATLNFERFVYRYYASTGKYVGVAIGVTPGDGLVEGGVYVLGNSFGSVPAYVGVLSDFILAKARCPVQVKQGCAAPTAGLRDKCSQPFSPDSIWNTALSRAAKLEPAGIGPATQKVYGDVSHFFKAAPGDPPTEWRRPGSFTGPRCVGGTSLLKTVPFPSAEIVPDVMSPDTYNNTFALLYPDGKTLAEGNVLARCEKNGPLYGEASPGDGSAGRAEYDIYGLGSSGGHGGSGLSGLGGTIRKGELSAANPVAISHVLKVEIFGEPYLSSVAPHHVWPAIRADDYASSRYKGTNSKLAMGSLLALPASTDCNAMGLTTAAAKRICDALRDYGAYIVDDSGWDAHAFVLDGDTKADFAKDYGYAFDSYTSPFRADTNRLFQVLQIVVNNTPATVGGGVGDRLRPKAACIGN